MPDPTPALATTWSTEETLPDPLPADPFPTIRAWFDEAHARADQPNPNAMTIATADPSGTPHARIVLCKALHEGPGFVVFYTNYNGPKGRQLAANPRAAAILHWDHTDRQIRLEGPIVKSPPEESDAYFRTRHWTSRVGAWASEQSEPIATRDDLIAKVGAAVDRLGLDLTQLMELDAGERTEIDIPRPPHWGGFRLWADTAELWCAGTGRVHDRARWTRELSPNADGVSFDPGPWAATRLQP
ncbi:MAG: pyridoxal 5'-phosphate synthase [Planctomycetota bacterium]